MNFVDRIKQIIVKLNEQGVPLPMARVNGAPTLTGTMVIMSFTTCLLGQIGKVTKLLGEVDLTQANYLLLICLSAYLGRKMQGQGNGKDVTLDKDEDKK